MCLHISEKSYKKLKCQGQLLLLCHEDAWQVRVYSSKDDPTHLWFEARAPHSRPPKPTLSTPSYMSHALSMHARELVSARLT